MTPTPEQAQAAMARLSLLEKACRVPGLEHFPVIAHANAIPLADDLATLLTLLEASARALGPFARVMASDTGLQDSLHAWPEDKDHWTAREHNWGAMVNVGTIREAHRILALIAPKGEG